MRSLAASIIERIQDLPDDRHFGRVTAIQGMLVEVGGVERRLAIGSRLDLLPAGGRRVPCEIVGFREGRSLALPFGRLDGIGLGCIAEITVSQPTVSPNAGWLGRVINALGEPIDGKGPLPLGGIPVPLRNSPPPAHQRKRMGGKLDLGVRPLNTFTTICMGQRLGIFAGSGVGKSVMMSMMARFTSADVTVIGLVGERGREVQEFLEDDLGPEGLARSVVVVATGDESPLMRRQAAQMTMAVAESFRDEGRDVLLLMDSVTRFAMAQREIGLSAGEPPTSKGYPPTTFVELPRLLERAGPGIHGAGSITALFAVLVEGDDHNEPIADAARGILDGHLVLERQIAERGRYPSINVLKSVSRALPMCNSEAENALLKQARLVISTYEDMAELIRLGAYRAGSDPKVDEAIRLYPAIEAMLSQDRDKGSTLAEGYAMLAAALGIQWPPGA